MESRVDWAMDRVGDQEKGARERKAEVVGLYREAKLGEESP